MYPQYINSITPKANQNNILSYSQYQPQNINYQSHSPNFKQNIQQNYFQNQNSFQQNRNQPVNQPVNQPQQRISNKINMNCQNQQYNQNSYRQLPQMQVQKQNLLLYQNNQNYVQVQKQNYQEQQNHYQEQQNQYQEQQNNYQEQQNQTYNQIKEDQKLIELGYLDKKHDLKDSPKQEYKLNFYDEKINQIRSNQKHINFSILEQSGDYESLNKSYSPNFQFLEEKYHLLRHEKQKIDVSVQTDFSMNQNDMIQVYHNKLKTFQSYFQDLSCGQERLFSSLENLRQIFKENFNDKALTKDYNTDKAFKNIKNKINNLEFQFQQQQNIIQSAKFQDFLTLMEDTSQKNDKVQNFIKLGIMQYQRL